MSLKVFYPGFEQHRDDREGLIERFRTLLDADIELYLEKTTDADDYHILICGRPSPEQLTASQVLHTVVIPWAGLSAETAALLKDFPQISVHNLHHNAVMTAETALALLFCAAKQTHVYDAELRQNDWSGRYRSNPAILLQGKSMLILGYGSIGRHVARVAQGMGIRVLGIRTSEGFDEELGVSYFSPKALPELLPETNILMVTIPLTPDTEGMIGAEELAYLKPPAILVNVGRGPVVDQQALYQALKSGKLAAAGFDVWYNYPSDQTSRQNTPPSNFPLNEFPNMVFSPHRGGGSVEMEELRIQQLAKLLNAAAAGEKIPNKLDLDAGY